MSDTVKNHKPHMTGAQHGNEVEAAVAHVLQVSSDLVHELLTAEYGTSYEDVLLLLARVHDAGKESVKWSLSSPGRPSRLVEKHAVMSGCGLYRVLAENQCPPNLSLAMSQTVLCHHGRMQRKQLETVPDKEVLEWLRPIVANRRVNEMSEASKASFEGPIYGTAVLILSDWIASGNRSLSIPKKRIGTIDASAGNLCADSIIDCFYSASFVLPPVRPASRRAVDPLPYLHELLLVWSN